MRRIDQATGILLLALAVWFAAVALTQYTYRGSTGPGSAFLPFWLAVAMGALALALVAQAARSGDGGGGAFPAGRGLLRLLVVVGATAAFIALMNAVGMMLGTVLFLVGLLRLLEGYAWRVAIGVAVATAGVNYLVFTFWLRVPFPVGWLGF